MSDTIRALRVRVLHPTATPLVTADGDIHTEWSPLAETVIADEHRPAYALDALAKLLTRPAVTAPEIASLRITVDAITLQQVPEEAGDA